MGSCCATVKGSSSNHQNTPEPLDRHIISLRIQDQETIPESRHIIRGAHTTEAEKSGQQKNLFISSESTKSLFSSLGISYSCKKGIKSSLQNQDDFSIIFENKTLLISVFDGHGINGSEISNYLHILLPHSILSHPDFPESISSAFASSFGTCNTSLHQFCASNNLSSDYSGSTCTVLVLKDSTLHMANIGDSHAIYQTSSSEVLHLSANHKPSESSELDRIRTSGGEVRGVPDEFCPRIFVKGGNLPGISVSRSFGDCVAQTIGVTAEPFTTEKRVGDTDRYLVLASDGVWEFISDQEAMQIVSEGSEPAARLAEAAWNRWRENEADAVDDITAVVLDIGQFNKYLKCIKN